MFVELQSLIGSPWVDHLGLNIVIWWTQNDQFDFIEFSPMNMIRFDKYESTNFFNPGLDLIDLIQSLPGVLTKPNWVGVGVRAALCNKKQHHWNNIWKVITEFTCKLSFPGCWTKNDNYYKWWCIPSRL